MQTPHKRKTLFCYVLIVLQLFLGIGALFGGGLLMIAPDGSLLGMPLSLLKYSSFNTYLIPGAILFFALGVYPVLVAVFLMTEKPLRLAETVNLYKETHWTWMHSLYIGFILIIWLTIEIYILQGIAIVHLVYMFLGLAIQAVTLLPSVKAHYTDTVSG
ncbi:hypothetical protein [Sporolactobacillus terrae]|uniref:Uncharacterized protein n=1 Tax=Sporolactobacillus terrae TaxID=269673 RepID=A0ABX5Q586_9BACL|nr:hypothetical protein [Sporolactobacillus terrae]QAA21806.1 hypothetical protein C0674_03760 [Sporolactobacillus terrae]QAA24779.1 hypothetical protein C0679_03735 [Sporolactobacillus terrae]UAK16606.1 hypothetical protein K7399_01105 [Sporolactobacillus terrae]